MVDRSYDSIILSMKIDDLIKVQSPDRIGYFWLDKDGNYTNDKEKLVKREETRISQTRYAETNEEYEFILKREAEKKGQNIDDYIEILLEDTKVMLDQNVREFRDLNIDLTDKRVRVKKFINYLENRNSEKEKIIFAYDKNIFKNEIGAKIYNRWEVNYRGEKKEQMNFSFVYWMLKGKYLNFNITPTNFKDWLIGRDVDINELYSEMKCFSNQRKNKFIDIEEIAKQS